MIARIYRPARNAMQSGNARGEVWLLEFEPEQRREREPLMGWTSSGDMKQQLRLTFSSKEEAVAYAERRGIAYRVAESPAPKPQKKSYAENFRWGRIGAWTH